MSENTIKYLLFMSWIWIVIWPVLATISAVTYRYGVIDMWSKSTRRNLMWELFWEILFSFKTFIWIACLVFIIVFS